MIVYVSSPCSSIALIAGGGLAIGTYNYLQNVPVKTVTLPTTRVVIASNNLGLGRQLRREDLQTIEWPKGSVPEGAFDRSRGLRGPRPIVLVVKHEAILPAKLASKEAGAGLPPIIPPGKRAVSVRVNEVIGVAGYVCRERASTWWPRRIPPRAKEDVTTKVVLSNIEVLTAGTRLSRTRRGQADAGLRRDAARQP